MATTLTKNNLVQRGVEFTLHSLPLQSHAYGIVSGAVSGVNGWQNVLSHADVLQLGLSGLYTGFGGIVIQAYGQDTPPFIYAKYRFTWVIIIGWKMAMMAIGGIVAVILISAYIV